SRNRSDVKFWGTPPLVETSAAMSVGPSSLTAAVAISRAVSVGMPIGIVRSIRITTSRPSCSTIWLVVTSGGTSVVHAASPDVMRSGRSTNVNVSTGGGCPSSKMVKSSAVRPRTGWRRLSSTETSTWMSSVPDRKTGAACSSGCCAVSHTLPMMSAAHEAASRTWGVCTSIDPEREKHGDDDFHRLAILARRQKLPLPRGLDGLEVESVGPVERPDDFDVAHRAVLEHHGPEFDLALDPRTERLARIVRFAVPDQSRGLDAGTPTREAAAELPARAGTHAVTAAGPHASTRTTAASRGGQRDCARPRGPERDGIGRHDRDGQHG